MAMLPKKPSEQRTSLLVWLLTAHLVSSYFTFIQAQSPRAPNLTIEVTPEYPLEGENVRLIPEKPTNDTESCLWFIAENETHLEIVLYYPSNNTYEPRLGFHSDHMPLEDCILAINNVSYLDMALYGLIMKLPTKFLLGEAFLLVRREEEPAPRKNKALGAGIIAGISAGCLVGILLVIGLVAYQAKGTPFRNATTTQPATQDVSASREAGQPIASNQNLDAEGNKI